MGEIKEVVLTNKRNSESQEGVRNILQIWEDAEEELSKRSIREKPDWNIGIKRFARKAV